MSNNMGTIYEPNTKPKVPPRTLRLKRQNAFDLLDDISKSSTSGYLDDGHFNSRIDRTPSFSGNYTLPRSKFTWYNFTLGSFVHIFHEQEGGIGFISQREKVVFRERRFVTDKDSKNKTAI